MEFGSNTMRQGISEVGKFSMNYTVTYNGENTVSKIEAQIKRKSCKDAPEIHSGYASFVRESDRYSFQLTSPVAGEDRRMLLDNFEQEIAELIK